MKQKIEWYKEVLDIEPGSKVFFPLAKLLAANKDTSEAISTLERGIVRHPDSIEAQLFLIELLSQHGDEDALQTQLLLLENTFSQYSSFWNIWSDSLAKRPLLTDAALALRFFAAALGGKPISWSSVIEQGLTAVLGGSITNLNTSNSLLDSSSDPEVLMDELGDEDNEKTDSSFSINNSNFSRIKETADSEFDEENEEPFSLRTRSMADVLAEQGDVAGALEIYNELLNTAVEDDKQDIQEKITILSNKVAQISDDDTNASSKENTRLVSLLESLAQRLESRAR